MKVGIVGAGITGLAAAYELSKKGHEVTIFERANVPGGLGTYIKVGNNYLERYYHHFFSSDKFIREYAKELGISQKLKFYTAKTGIFKDGIVFPFSSIGNLLQFMPLSFIDRVRCGIFLGILKIIPFPIMNLDTVSSKKFIIKYAGQRVYEKIWRPLLEGKFSKFASNVPALWLWGRVFDRSLKLGYFDGSVKTLFDKMIQRIKKSKGKIYLQSEITGIEKTDKGVCVYTQGRKNLFDRVIITTVSPIAAKLIRNKLPKKYKNSLEAVDHLGAVCVIVELKHSLQSQYWVNLCDKKLPVLVMIEHTNFISKSAYNNKTIVYLANYIHREDTRFRLTDKQIVDDYCKIFPLINPAFQRSWISKIYVSRVPRAQTIFKINALKNKPIMQMPVEGIYLANIDQMYPHDRNLNQGIELGKKVAQLIIKC